MAEEKKSFLLYCDQRNIFEMLTDEQAGRLIKTIYSYVNDENPSVDELYLKLAFEPIKLQLKRDLKRWGSVKQERSKAGILGNLKRYNEDLYNKVVNGDIELDEAQKVAKARKSSQSDTNVAVTDNVTVTVTDNVNVNVNDTVNDIDKVNNTKNSKKEFSDDVILCVKNCIKYFDKELHPVTAKEKNSWCDTVDKLNRIDKLEFEVIEEIVKQIKKDDFWCSKFLSLNKLRNKNKDGVAYYKVFSQIIKRKNNGTNKKTSEQRAIEFAQRKAREREFGN